MASIILGSSTASWKRGCRPAFQDGLRALPIRRPGRPRSSSNMFWKANDVSFRSRPFPTLAVKNFLTNSLPQVKAERCSPRAWTTDARALLIGDVEFPSSQSRLRVEDGDAPGGCKASGSKSIDRLLPRCRRNPACRSTPRPGSLIFLGRHLPTDAALRLFDRYP